MSWLFQNIPLLIFAFIVFSIVRAIKRAKAASTEHEATHSESDEQRRVREIQERIRKIAAERGGTSAPTQRPVLRAEPPPMPRAERPPLVPQLDPFGGPIKRRLLDELQRRLQVPAAPPPLVQPTAGAKAEHRRELAAERQVVVDAEAVVVRRAARDVAEKEENARSEGALLASAHTRLLADLQDPQSLRRAFVLREVLGPPVGLR
ncbi:MAG: hypothetical protein ABIZ49_02325 [Opitutaceae bacterium]